LVSATRLAHPIANTHLDFYVDASNYAVGAALHQLNGGQLQPLSFYSKVMKDTQKRTLR